MNKRLIVCCDGTWADLDMHYITNVGRLAQALLPTAKKGSQTIPQVIYYDDGVGADAGGIDRLIEGATGRGIDNIIYEAYRFICFNYEPGDEVCIFGFSRGAFTARSVAGMIGRIGLIPRSELKYVPQAYVAYRSKNENQQKALKKTSKAKDIDITLLGCWDTVGALGIPDKSRLLPLDRLTRRKHQFHDNKVGRNVKLALHAVAVDERRKEFDATLMQKSRPGQKIVQKWFPGDHGCVGGGRWEKRGLSNITLRWMVDEAKRNGVDLAVDWARLHDQAITDHSIYFDNSVAGIFGDRHRRIDPAEVKIGDLDDSVFQRWAEDSNYRSRNLKSTYGNRLDARAGAISGVRIPPQSLTRLNIGQFADIQVRSANSNNQTQINVDRNQQYEIEIERTQVWKDGGFDPCDISGWNAISSGPKSKLPWEDGDQVDLNVLKTRIVGWARKRRLVQDADWFQLVVGIDGDQFMAPTIKKPGDEKTPWLLKYKAVASGRLSFAANDLRSRLDIVDKYDNNAGWVWVRVRRVA